MNIERQRQILREKHGLDILFRKERFAVYEVSGAPRYTIWGYEGQEEIYVHAQINGRTGHHNLHNFVAAVTYAKAELARIERLAAAKENQ